jgi:hypothetical protein
VGLRWISPGMVMLACLAGAGRAGAEGASESGDPRGPLYRKPFLKTGGAMVGGYMDLEFRADEGGSGFDQRRFVPFIYAQVSDRVHVASEIEFEHGGFVAGDKETDGEIKIEFATVDFTVSEAVNLRGGVVLSPLGRLNAHHDAPLLDLTERPLVDRNIIPTTLSESGMGFFGTAYPTEAWVVEYEAYLVNGFGADAVEAGVLDLRDGRGSQGADNNNGRAFTGRLGVSPRLGTELGASVHAGDYDDAGRRGLTIAALDARFSHGPFQMLGEGVLARAGVEEASIEVSAPSADPTAADDARAAGFYVEARARLLAGAIGALPLGVFTAAIRADYVDHDRNVSGADQQRLTLGLNFRPTEETVFKNDVLFDRARAGGASEWGDAETSYRFSLATYF